jgi:hypothetical protein
MIKFITTLLLAASIGTYGGAALAHAEHGQPQQGGVVAEAGEAQFEIVAKAGKLTVFVSSHGAPLATAGASGKLTVLAGTNKQEIELKPDGDNRMAGQGNLPPEAKLLVAIQLPGKKPLQARAVAK